MPETLRIIVTAFAFAIGAVVGSFLNVVIWRVPRGESIVAPPSHCPGCNERLAWYHNIPLVSWIVLRGRCAYCRTRISPRYPLVELITGLLAVACVTVFGLSPVAVRTFVFVSLLVALTYIDLDHWLLPHGITWPGIVLGLGTAWLPGAPGLVPSLLGAGAGFAGFWILRVVAERLLKKEAMGGGDLFLLAMIGAFLGWRALLPVVFLASVQGSVIGALALALRHRAAGASAGPPPETPPGTADAVPAEAAVTAVPSGPGGGEGETEAATSAEDAEWTPPPGAVPFGPFLSLAALEMAFLGDWILTQIYRFVGLSA